MTNVLHLMGDSECEASSGWTWINIGHDFTRSCTNMTEVYFAKINIYFTLCNLSSCIFLVAIYSHQEVDIWWVESCCKGTSAVIVADLDWYLEGNPEEFHWSGSKCWKWWDISYVWWNIFKIHKSSINFRSFRLVLLWGM